MDNLEKIYLLYGEDKFLRDSYLKKIKGSFETLIDGINYIIKDETNYDGLIQDIETIAFGFSNKLIVAKNTGLFKKSVKDTRFVDDFIDYIENSKLSDVCIVFIEEDVQITSALFKQIEKKGKVLKFSELKPNEVTSKVITIAKQYNVTITLDVASYFVNSCGTNMQEIINELSMQGHRVR